MDKVYDKIETKTKEDEEEGQFMSQHYLSTNNRQLNEKKKKKKEWESKQPIWNNQQREFENYSATLKKNEIR